MKGRTADVHAVVASACALVASMNADPTCPPDGSLLLALKDSVHALNANISPGGDMSVRANLVCPGDRMKTKKGDYLLVIESDAKAGGQWLGGRREPAGQRIKVNLGGGRMFTKIFPPDAPVTVVRGDEGVAVDVLNRVFGGVDVL